MKCAKKVNGYCADDGALIGVFTRWNVTVWRLTIAIVEAL
jgi:hypothetical protein